MSTPALRPTFRLPLAQPPEAAMRRLQSYLDQHHASSIRVQRAGHHMTLTVVPNDRHFWSPWLNLEFESPVAESIDRHVTSSQAASLHARFSPAPSLWTGFMVVYFSLATAGFFAVMWSLAQWTMGGRPTALWATLACAVGCAALWWVSLVGQKLARAQMLLLRDAVETAYQPPDNASPETPSI